MFIYMPRYHSQEKCKLTPQNSSCSRKNIVKLIIVPYINSPPTILIIIASGRIISQCASTTGNAIFKPHIRTYSTSPRQLPCPWVIRTNTHNHQKAGHEPPQLHHTAPTPTVHEVIPIAGLATYPVRYWCDAVCGDHEQGEVIVEEGAAEDYEEEADGEDLYH
jgi:hypothetical protein